VDNRALVAESTRRWQHVLHLIDAFGDALEQSQDPILNCIEEVFKIEAVPQLLEAIATVINEDTCKMVGKGLAANRNQQVFAVKQGVDPFLDVARQTYMDVIEKIYQTESSLIESASVSSLKLAQCAFSHGISFLAHGLSSDENFFCLIQSYHHHLHKTQREESYWFCPKPRGFDGALWLNMIVMR